MTVTIRLATPDDAGAIAGIYGPMVSSTPISFEFEPPDASEMRRRVVQTLRRYPWLVCEASGQVVGYAYASQHRARSAYQWSVEVSV